MRTFYFIIASLLLLSSCQEASKPEAQQAVSSAPTNANQRKIADWYAASVSIEKSNARAIGLSDAELDKTATGQPQEFKAMTAMVKGLRDAKFSAYELSTKHYEVALQLLKRSKADSLKAKAYRGLGCNYKNTGNYPKAFEYLYRALRIYEKENRATEVCGAYTDIAEVYFQKGDIATAKESIKTGLKALAGQQANLVYLSAAHSLANIYGISGDYKNALAIDNRGIFVADSIDAPNLKSAFLDNKANCFLSSGRSDSARYYFNACLKIDLLLGNKKQLADSYANLGMLSRLDKNYPEAERLLLHSIAILKEIDGKPNLEKSYTALVKVYEDQGKFAQANQARSRQSENYKAMLDARHESALAEYKIVYDTQKKENRIHCCCARTIFGNSKFTSRTI